jgi:hypothetical protein
MIDRKHNFGQAHAALMKEYQAAHQALKALHADETFLNDSAQEYRQATEKLSEIARDIFKLKNAWMTALALLEVKPEEERQKKGSTDA